MINRVDGNYYNDYSQMKTVNTIQDNGEKFSLDYKQESLHSEETEKEKKESKEATNQAAERNGVKLELSQNSAYTSTKSEHTNDELKTQEKTEQKSILGTIQEMITDIVQSVKDFFYRIWNDTDVVQAPEEQEAIAKQLDLEVARRSDEEWVDKEIQQYLHTGDLPQVINLLTDNGRKTIAKNSTLLTYYDRNGRVVEPSASDKERILHGDRSSRKL